MDARYSVTVDPASRMVLIRLAGFFTDADLDGLRDLCHREFPRLGADLNRHVTLIDISAADVQSGASLTRFAELLNDPGLRGGRVAFLVSVSLARSQARRLAGNREAGFFDTVEEARAWLHGRPARHAA